MDRDYYSGQKDYRANILLKIHTCTRHSSNIHFLFLILGGGGKLKFTNRGEGGSQGKANC